MQIVNDHLRFPQAPLVEPTTSGFIHFAAEVDRRPPFLYVWESRRKRALLARCKELARRLERLDEVLSAVVFKAVFIPPGRGRFLRQRRGKVHIARFDIAVLIETTSVDAARTIRQHPLCQELEHTLREGASYVHAVVARNARRIGDVDHSRDGVFLFNYFFSDDTQENLDVWEYTAGWFAAETGLDNSTLLLPEPGERSEYGIINHCRWDHMTDILPSLLFKPTFRTYVLANFEANHVAAMPILYRLA